MTATDDNKTTDANADTDMNENENAKAGRTTTRLPVIGWDFGLMAATTFALLAIGIVCVYGVWYSFLAYKQDPQWLYTPLYTQYISAMNTLVYPLIVVLLIALGLCIPKRIMRRKVLTRFNAGILAITLLLAMAFGMAVSIWFILVTSIVFQTVVLILTIQKNATLFYEREGHIVHIGSALLHLGTVVFIFDFAGMRTSEYHIAIFWVSTILMGAGIMLAFYAEEIYNLLQRL